MTVSLTLHIISTDLQDFQSYDYNQYVMKVFCDVYECIGEQRMFAKGI